jgi:hypothetical protein
LEPADEYRETVTGRRRTSERRDKRMLDLAERSLQEIIVAISRSGRRPKGKSKCQTLLTP